VASRQNLPTAKQNSEFRFDRRVITGGKERPAVKLLAFVDMLFSFIYLHQFECDATATS
jgi:hypothetical protein